MKLHIGALFELSKQHDTKQAEKEATENGLTAAQRNCTEKQIRLNDLNINYA